MPFPPHCFFMAAKDVFRFFLAAYCKRGILEALGTQSHQRPPPSILERFVGPNIRRVMLAFMCCMGQQQKLGPIEKSKLKNAGTLYG